MPDERAERTNYLGLLALMIAGADTENWSYPYWNIKQIDAALAALADAPRDGTVLFTAPGVAPTAALSATPGSIAGSVTLEIAQTFVDAYGRETDAGALATIATPAAIEGPAAAPTLGTPSLGEASGYEGGLLEVWFSWTDGGGGETLPSPVASVDIPYQAGGLSSEVAVTLPSTPAAAGAAGANIYLRHRGGNIILGYRILTASTTEITLAGAADCYRSLPFINSTGSVNAVDITGVAAPAGAVLTRFYLRNQGDAWGTGDQRLKLAGADEWDPATIAYPLLYTGLSTELTAGHPPAVSQVKAIRPIDLSTEAYGELSHLLLPAEAVLETDLALSAGEAVLSGLAVGATDPVSLAVSVQAGMALIAAGRFTKGLTQLTIPAADPENPRIDLIILDAAGALQGPTELGALKGTAAASPAAPSVPGGTLALAEVRVEAGSASIAAEKITDRRFLVPTLVAEATARIAHVADAEAHSSKAGTMATANVAVAAESETNFNINGALPCLVTEVYAACTAGAFDYDIKLYEDSARLTLAYRAGNGPEEGIDAATYTDRIPWEWFGGATIYGTVANHSAEAITNVAITLNYRK